MASMKENVPPRASLKSKIPVAKSKAQQFHQSDIHFEKDPLALESILNPGKSARCQTSTRVSTVDHTGVNPSRHTLAGDPSKMPKNSIFGPQRNVNIKAFQKMCEDFVSVQQSSEQPRVKRRCTNTRDTKNDTGYNFSASLAPAEIDFCIGTEITKKSAIPEAHKSPYFKAQAKGKGGAASETPFKTSRQSLPARTPMRHKPNTTNPFVACVAPVTRPSVAMHTPVRLMKVNKDDEVERRHSIYSKPPARLMQEAVSELRPSLAPQTPGRVVVKPVCTDNPITSDPRLSMNTRYSLAAQTPGRVVKPVCTDDPVTSDPRLSMNARYSLAPQTPGRVVKPVSTCDPITSDPRLSMNARQSLTAQLPGRVLKSSTSDAPRLIIASRLSLAPQTPGRVLKKESKDSQEVFETSNYVNVTIATPGRVLKQIPDDNGRGTPLRNPRPSLVASTPGRVLKQIPDDNGYGTPLREPRPSLVASTPGRVLKQIPDDNSCGTPVREPRPSLVASTPGRVLKQIPDDNGCGTPVRVLKKTEPATGTPMRVLKEQAPNVFDSPLRVHSPKPVLHLPGRVLSARPSPVVKLPTRVASPRPDVNTPSRGSRPLPVMYTDVIPSNHHVVDTPDRTPTRGADKDLLDSPIEEKPSLSLPGQTDLMIWKTTLSKINTPIKKEILTLAHAGGVSKETRLSPRPMRQAFTSVKKKNVRWADTLACFRSPGHKKSTSQRDIKSLYGERNIDTVFKSCVFHADDPECSDDVITGSGKQGQRDESQPAVVNSNAAWRLAEDVTIGSHDAMQEEPSLETCTTPPRAKSCSPDITHNAPATAVFHSQDNMQLPVITQHTAADNMQLPVGIVFPGSSGECDDIVNRNWSQSEQEVPVSTRVCSVTHSDLATQFVTDSPRMTQLDLGQSQNEGNTTTVVNRDEHEILRQHIEIVEQKKQELYLLQMQLEQQFNKGHGHRNINEVKGQGQVVSGVNDNVENVSNIWHERTLDDHTMVTNSEYEKNNKRTGNQLEFENTSQGLLSTHPRELDVNSNITIGNTPQTKTVNTVTDAHLSNCEIQAATSVEKYQTVPSYHAPKTFGDESVSVFSTPNNQHQRHCDDNITPFILRKNVDDNISKSEEGMVKYDLPMEVMDDGAGRAQFMDTSLNALDCFSAQTALMFAPTPVQKKVHDSVTGSQKLNLPIWTPLAMKSVAKQQIGSKESVSSSGHHLYDKLMTKVDFTNLKDKSFEQEADAERLVLSEADIASKGKNLNEREATSKSDLGYNLPVSTPSKSSAFRPVGRTSLTPTIGSMSLRGNSGAKITKSSDKLRKKESIHKSLFRAANERFQEALLDDEVALYACRLVHKAVGFVARECYDPVAKILLDGDEMHFVPVTDDFYSQAFGEHIAGSAFNKYDEK